MNTAPQELTVERRLSFSTPTKGRKRARVEADATTPSAALPAGRLPRITRLLALAHRFDHLVQTGQVRDFAELARVGHVTRARLSQIMDLLFLAPDIQECLFNLPKVETGKDGIAERSMRMVDRLYDWDEQRCAWRQTFKTVCPDNK